MKKLLLLSLFLSNLCFAQLGEQFIWVKADTFKSKEANNTVVLTTFKNTGGELRMNSSDLIFTDFRITKKGLEYAADYSSNYSSRSLVDKGYVTSVVSSLGTVTSVGLISSDFTVSGSPITTSGSITANLNTTGVSAGSYGIVTVDTKGRVSSGKRQAVYSGTTDSNGAYTVTFGTSYSVAPNIQANLVNQSATNQYLRITSVSTTGFTVNAFQINSVNLLGVDVLLSTTVNINGA